MEETCVSHNVSSMCTPIYSPNNDTAQLFPIPKEYVRQLATAIWYIRKVAILRVPLSTLQRQTERRPGPD